MITLQLTAKQARLLRRAVEQEIRKGSSTFLSGRDVQDLGRINSDLQLQLAGLEAAELDKAA